MQIFSLFDFTGILIGFCVIVIKSVYVRLIYLLGILQKQQQMLATRFNRPRATRDSHKLNVRVHFMLVHISMNSAQHNGWRTDDSFAVHPYTPF